MFRRRRENAPVLDRLDNVTAVVLHDGTAAGRGSEFALLRRIAGLGRPARWLEDIHFELLVES